MKPHFITTPEELNQYIKCFKENGNEKKLDNLKWMHFDNLLQEAKICMLKDEESEEERVASIYAAMPVKFSAFGKDIKAAQSLDTLTDKDYRGKGLFKKSAALLYDNLVETDYKLVYGFPNDKSAFGFFNRLDWQEVTEVPFIIKPLKFSFLLRAATSKSYTNSFFAKIGLTLSSFKSNRNSNFEISHINRFDDRYDKLWNRFSENLIGIKRDAGYLNWRLKDKPNAVYHNYEATRANELLGFVSFKIEYKHKVKMLYVMELLYDKAEQEVGKNLLKTALRVAKEEGCEVCLAWNLPHLHNQLAFKKMGFVKLPKAFRFIKLFFGVRELEKMESSQKLIDPENWYLSYLDSDTV